MGKVVTSAGLQDFVQSGKVTHVTDHKPNGKEPPLEVKQAAPVAELSDNKAPTTESKQAEPEQKAPAEDVNEGLEPDELEFSEQIRKKIGKKHRAMKEAQESAAEAERFAEQQFNERKLAEKRAEEAERRAKELEAKVAPPAKEPELKAPDIKDFTNDQGQVDWDKYTDAKADYRAELKWREKENERIQKENADKQAQTEAQWRARLQVAETKYPDFLKVVGAAETWVPNAVLQYITESEYGADITYFLASHPEEAKSIAKLSPIAAIARVGKLETTFEKPAKTEETPPAAPKAPERGGAPPPITPISASGAGTVVVDPSKMDYKQLRAYERQRALESKRR